MVSQTHQAGRSHIEGAVLRNPTRLPLKHMRSASLGLQRVGSTFYEVVKKQNKTKQNEWSHQKRSREVVPHGWMQPSSHLPISISFPRPPPTHPPPLPPSHAARVTIPEEEEPRPARGRVSPVLALGADRKLGYISLPSSWSFPSNCRHREGAAKRIWWRLGRGEEDGLCSQ